MYSIFVMVSTITPTGAAALAMHEINGFTNEVDADRIAQHLADTSTESVRIRTTVYKK